MSLMRRNTKFIVPLVLILAHSGCASKTNEHEKPDHHSSSADPHAGHVMSAQRSALMITTEPAEVSPGTPVHLQMMIHAADGKMVRKFETTHEKLVHLIIVRDGLDRFAHEHPAVDDEGNITIDFAFPEPGTYHLFADHKPAGASLAVAVGNLKVAGEIRPAAKLSPNAPGRVSVDGIVADVGIENAQAGSAAKITFTLFDKQKQPIADLQPYLGAMGHLVVISADATEYVHAHPSGDAKSAPDGRVAFEAHFAKPGLYKGWGQFQRSGTILTVPFILRVD
jgi:hypothetical protein